MVTNDPEATPLPRRDVDLMRGPLRVFDDEHLLVLHRPPGRGYRMAIGGIGDDFQLHTLLAAALVGVPADGMIPGAAPDKRWVSAATDGPDVQPGGIAGQFSLADASPEGSWNEAWRQHFGDYSIDAQCN